MAIGSDGMPMISARDESNNALVFVKCFASNCSTYGVTTIDDPVASSVGFATSIAAGSDGLPVISYYDLTAQALKFARCAATNCATGATIVTLDDNAGSVGDYSDIAIGVDGFPLISYQDTTSGSLKLAKCGNLACSTSVLLTLDDPANSIAGAYTSIAIGADGVPVIAHHDPTAGSLKVTRCGNSACSGPATTTTVDDPVHRVGRHASLAIGADGLPVIAYQDVDAEALEVAKCGTRSCQ